MQWMDRRCAAEAKESRPYEEEGTWEAVEAASRHEDAGRWQGLFFSFRRLFLSPGFLKNRLSSVSPCSPGFGCWAGPTKPVLRTWSDTRFEVLLSLHPPSPPCRSRWHWRPVSSVIFNTECVEHQAHCPMRSSLGIYGGERQEPVPRSIAAGIDQAVLARGSSQPVTTSGGKVGPFPRECAAQRSDRPGERATTDLRFLFFFVFFVVVFFLFCL